MTEAGGSTRVEAEIAAIIDDSYAALSFDEGGEPDWARFASGYVTGAVLALRLFPGDERIRVFDNEGYARAQMRDDLAVHGYVETPGERSFTVVGDVASVLQRFSMDFPDGTSTPAVDIFSLVRLDGRWKIVSVVSDTL
ncbi:hypothetical protein ACFSBZ_11080 [Amnibacterium flavum]|uniref:DUF4440 domain-containing protein n=1 Tax=Amnibacterium flavum TaxID=2173173 RepID=A0A2V1HUK3_9MICO|nr:hypothetical protein [Amnibacterium flavum]PVZ95372.1 hypothetical protein DDQ50_02305 [Amnibacterium flavum]